MKRDHLGGIILGEGRKFTAADRLTVAELAREDTARGTDQAYYEVGIIWCPVALGHADLQVMGGYGQYDPRFWEQDNQGRLRRRRP